MTKTNKTADTNFCVNATARRPAGIPIGSVLATVLVASTLIVGLTAGPSVHAAASTNPQNSGETTPVIHSSPVESKLHYTAVEGAYYYTIALRSDGSVWAWGRNLWGELGVSENIRYRHTFSPVRVPELLHVTAISAAGGNNAAVQADGTVWEWGSGKLPHKVESITSAQDVVVGSHLTIALLQNGTVWSWQSPFVQGIHSDHVRKPHQVKGLKEITQIESAGLNGYAVKKDGSVWTWNEPDAPGKQPSKPIKLKGLSNISSITGSYTSLLALDKNGKVWYLDEKGKISNFHHELKVKKMDRNSHYTLLLTTSGEVYSYGRTVTGKEGKVTHLPAITDVSAGYYHSLALSAEGTAWGWGGDKYQEAGAPATSSGGMVYKPVQAALGTDVYINGELFQSVYPAVVTSKTVQLPIKVIAAVIGAEFEVHKTEGSIDHYTLRYEDQLITLRPNETKIRINSFPSAEQHIITLLEPMNSYSGATTVPFEVLRSLGLNVSWDAEKAMLTIDDTDGTAQGKDRLSENKVK